MAIPYDCGIHTDQKKALSFCGQNWRLKQFIQCTNSSPLTDWTPSICRSNYSTYRNLFPFKVPFSMANRVATCVCQKPVKTYAWIQIFLMCMLHHMAASHPLKSCMILAKHNENFKNYHYSNHLKFSKKICHLLWYPTITWRGDKIKPPNYLIKEDHM